jgi:hypothetical protein
MFDYTFKKYQNMVPYTTKVGEEFNEQRYHFHEEEVRCCQLFKEDLFIELGITNNSKKEYLHDRAYKLANRYQRSSLKTNFEAIYIQAKNLVDLIK